MTRALLAVLVAAASLTAVSAAPSSAAPVDHVISVAGADVGMYPAYAPDVDRYGVTTSSATGGTVKVTATTTDPDGVVLVNGRPTTGSTTSVSGLEDGDEISVIFRDSGTTSVHSLFYLPAGFPTLEVTADLPGRAAGLVGLTLSQWSGGTPAFETAVDSRAVPVHVRRTPGSPLDLKRQPNGHYSVSRPTTTPGRTGQALVELDETFQEIASYETQGLKNTDGHDSILRPDGSRFLMAYEPDAGTGKTDAVIQEFDPSGDLVWTWNSRDHVDIPGETTMRGSADYAHINSIQVMADGDILASFRHLSSVFKIARTPHDGFAVGDVVWRLGGRISDFTFADDPYPAGPCAQHTASQLANGNILIFDNGSGAFGQNVCVNPADPSGDSVPRAFTRITEYSLDEQTGTATLAWDYVPVPGRFAFFAGSVERLGNGNTLIGWAASRQSSTTEVAPDGEVVWEFHDTNSTVNSRYMSYRSTKFAAADATDPEVDLGLPDGGSYPQGTEVSLDLTCTDRGGSNLHSCTSDATGGLLDTSTLGEHTVTVTATDGASNTTSRTRSYTVVPVAVRPDAVIRGSSPGWVGDDVYGAAHTQRVDQPLARKGNKAVSIVRIQNDGTGARRFALRGKRGNGEFAVVYVAGGVDRTKRVVAGTYRTPSLAPGEELRMRVVVTRKRKAAPGDRRNFKLVVGGAGTTDAVRVQARATRP